MTQKQNISSLENKMKIILPHGISLCSIKDDMAIERKILTQRIHDCWQKNSFMLYRRGKQISMKAYISRFTIKQQYKKDTDWISQIINRQMKERERKKMSVSEHRFIEGVVRQLSKPGRGTITCNSFPSQ